METQLDERLLLVLGQGSENLGSIQEMVLVEELVDVVGQQGEVQQEGEPVAIDQEQSSDEGMQTGFRNEPWIQLVTQLNWVDVVTLQVGVHDGEENL